MGSGANKITFNFNKAIQDGSFTVDDIGMGWLAKSNFCPMGDFFKPCPSRTKAGFKKSPSGGKVGFWWLFLFMQKSPIIKTKYLWTWKLYLILNSFVVGFWWIYFVKNYWRLLHK
jgi:hypothetical protein